MKQLIKILFLCLILLPFYALTQNDTGEVNTLNRRSLIYKRSDPDSSFYLAAKALVLAEKLNFSPGIIMANINAGMAKCNLNEFANSLPYLSKALSVAKISGNKYYIGEAYFYLSQVHRFQSNYGLSINYAFSALKMYEAINYKEGIANSYNGIANVYYDQQNHQKALHYFLKTVALMDSTHSEMNKSIVYLNLGLAYSDVRKFDSAMYFFKRSLDIREKRKNLDAVADVYTNMGVAFSTMGDYSSALEYLLKASEIYEKNGNAYYLGIAYTNLGDVYLQTKQYKEAEEYLLKGLSMSEKIDDKEGVKTACGIIANLYATMNQFEKAFYYNRRFMAVKDSLLNQRNQNQINEIQTRYETDKRDKEIELLNKDKLLQESIIEKQNTQRLAFIGGIIILLGFSFFIFRSFKRKQRDNTIIQQKKKELENKQKEILDSINYAQRIQKVLLPNEKFIDKSLTRLKKNRGI